MPEFTLIPILGRKTDCPANSPTVLKMVTNGVALSYDVGGVNFDLQRKRNSCSKSYGYTKYSSTANAQATRCQGLYEWWDGTRNVHVAIDNGRVYYYDSNLSPTNILDGSSTVYGATDADLFSFCKLGTYMIFSDHGNNPPAKWQWGDANISALVTGTGSTYTFRYLDVFQRRVLGMYSNQTNGDIDLRWTEAYPDTAIGSLTFPAANQLYIPNDDSIVGGHPMGQDQFYVYCKNSIQQIVYYQDYESPFRLYTAVPKGGACGHHGIVNLGDRHLLFNRDYGFVEYRGGTEFPYGGKAISDSIESDIAGMNSAYYDRMVGVYQPLTRRVCWAVNMSGSSTPDYLLFYDLMTGDWTTENRAMRYVDVWQISPSYTWNDFVTELGGSSSLWPSTPGRTWAFYSSERSRLVYAASDGYVYYHATDALDTAALDSYRIEPVLDFGDPKMMKTILEIWFDIGVTGSYSIHVYHRMGQTLGELTAQTWTSLGTVSCNSPNPPALRNFAKTARLHQIKWGTDGADEPYSVAGITIKYQPRSEN